MFGKPTIFGKLLDVLPKWPLLMTWSHSQKLLKVVIDGMICPLHPPPPHLLSLHVPLLVSSSFYGIQLFLLRFLSLSVILSSYWQVLRHGTKARPWLDTHLFEFGLRHF